MDRARIRRTGIVPSATLLMCTAWIVASTAMAGEPELLDGKKLFLMHCSSCHGVDGRGQTSLSELIRVETPDLTRITVRQKGWFPEALIGEIIDGRFKIHGEGTMPIWGRVLTRDEIIAISGHLYRIQVSSP